MWSKSAIGGLDGSEKKPLGGNFYKLLFFNVIQLENRLHTEIKLISISFQNELSMRLTCFFPTFSPNIANFALGE